MRKTRVAAYCLILWLGAAGAARAESELFSAKVALCAPIRIPVPAAVIPERMFREKRLAIGLTAVNAAAGWTVHTGAAVTYLTDGTRREPLADAPAAPDAHLGAVRSGAAKELVFRLPPEFAGKDLTVVVERGLFSMLAAPRGDYTLRAWIGLRPEFRVHVDRMNRNAIIDCTAFGRHGKRFVYRASDGRVRETTAATARFRFADPPAAFTVTVEAETVDGEKFTRELAVTPHPAAGAAPFPAAEVRSGPCVYSVDDLASVAREGLGNLAVLWNEKSPAAAKEAPLRELAAAGVAFSTIYRSGRDNRETAGRYREWTGGRYYGNNIGEFAGYLYQGPKEAAACRRPVDFTDLRTARDEFIDCFIAPRARQEHEQFASFFSTCGATLADYELAGGVDFLACELYAVGAQNLNFATAEMRGAARKWRPEFWGGWLAEEWQTFNVPYDSQQKYALLRAGLFSQYLMGTAMMVLESGAHATQAHRHTRGAADKRQGFDGFAPTHYRATLRDFHRFLRARPRAAGSPETPIALLRGNLDAWVGMRHAGFAVWAQHGTAARDARWRQGAPEDAWEQARHVFTPIGKDALAPYANYWIGGSPWGQVDVAGLAEDSRPADLARYRLAVGCGWNTLTPELARTLAAYVRDGGHLLLCLPHFSTRSDREYAAYAPGDLGADGDLRELIDLRVTGFTKASGAVTGSAAAPGGDDGDPLPELRDEPVAETVCGAATEVTATVGGRPLIVSAARGQGRVTVLLGKNYPGSGAYAAVYRRALAAAAAAARPPLWLRPLPEDRDAPRYIHCAAYADTLYFLNTDCVRPRTVTAVADGRETRLTLAPCEFQAWDRQTLRAAFSDRMPPETAENPGK